jgi:hypothetical protein
MTLAAEPQALQQAVDVTHAWCCKWRMKANVGPNKSAVMLFAPQCAPQPLQTGDVMWGGEPLPVVDKYKYLGVMLARRIARGVHMWRMWWRRPPRPAMPWAVCCTTVGCAIG